MRDLLRAMARFDERPRLRDVRPATLVVHGRSDAVIGPDAAVELARGIPRARLAVLDGADHFAFLTHRDRVLKELRYFWTSTGKS
jgi:pimeloyl-[acyl-carrier protein] methyl ester esterase